MLVIEIHRPDLSEVEFLEHIKDVHRSIDGFFAEKSANCDHGGTYWGMDGKQYCKRCLLEIKGGG